jgi:hypothetical protein
MSNVSSSTQTGVLSAAGTRRGTCRYRGTMSSRSLMSWISRSYVRAVSFGSRIASEAIWRGSVGPSWLRNIASSGLSRSMFLLN